MAWVPARTGTNMEPDTIAELSRHPRIIAIKDAAGSAERVSAIRRLCDITILSGDDALSLAQIALGADGVISVVSNIAPAAMSRMVRSAREDSFAAAREEFEKLYPVMKAMFLETNPGPVKKALELMGIFDSGDPRLPLVPLGKESLLQLRDVLEQAGIL